MPRFSVMVHSARVMVVAGVSRPTQKSMRKMNTSNMANGHASNNADELSTAIAISTKALHRGEALQQVHHQIRGLRTTAAYQRNVLHTGICRRSFSSNVSCKLRQAQSSTKAHKPNMSNATCHELRLNAAPPVECTL